MIVEIGGGVAAPSEGNDSREKSWVAATSVVAAVALTGMKLVVGLATGSLGILSEALHSALDLVAAVVTLFAVRASARPADSRHPFGHGKVENLSALFETALLLVTCGWIVYEAVKRLLGGAVEIDVTAWAFIVMAVSIVIDVSRSRALSRVAKKTGSQALEADALHFSTDVWSSSVVIVGLVAVWLAPTLDAPWLVRADAVAALGVAAIVVWVSLTLGRRTVADLLDETPPEVRDRVEEAARLSGVLEVGRVRVRRSGSEYFVDLTLKAEPDLTLEGAHVLADRVERAVADRLPGADVVVHLEPMIGEGEPPTPTASEVRSIARSVGLGAHGVRLANGPDGPTLELHVEVDRDLDVAAAHERANVLEAQLRRRFKRLARIVVHIEPRDDAALLQGAVTAEAIQRTAEQVAADRGVRCRISDIVLVGGEAGPAVTFHCATAPDTAITEAHTLTAALESVLRERFPGLDRVTIHIEPLPLP
jgi:cation diffusion facilitator family transporter